jgi:lysylphosphatidylglycerol synthetase-like protein (DUF2156 family)
MESTQQTKLEKATTILCIIAFDIITVSLYIELIRVLNKTNTLADILPISCICVSIIPFIISIHIKNISKKIKTLFLEITVISACIIVGSLLLNDYFIERLSDFNKSICHLLIGIAFLIIGTMMCIKLFINKKTD